MLLWFIALLWILAELQAPVSLAGMVCIGYMWYLRTKNEE